MIDTILFDLDGTLLPMDTDVFTKRYFKELSIKLKDFFTPEEVTKHMWDSTSYMINREERKQTNQEAFLENFYKNITHSEDVLNPILDDFYERDFNNVKEVTDINQNIIKAVKVLKKKGYTLVIASNPLFPKKAMLNRVKWAGLDEKDFVFITSFEEMHYSKPYIDFYKEVLSKINKQPSNCMMVGNDIVEDMIVHTLGVTTYLISDCIIGNIKDSNHVDYSGNYNDFYEFVKQLPSLL